MKKIHLTILVAAVPVLGRAQPNLDSLWNIWQDETQADTTRLVAIDAIAWYGHLFTQPDSAFYFAQLQFDFAQSKGLPDQMADARQTQGISYYVRGQYPQALEYNQEALAIREEAGNELGVAKSLGNIGLIYEKQGNYPMALAYHQKSLAIAEKLKDIRSTAITLMNIGVIYGLHGYESEALETFEESLAIYEELGDEKGGIAQALTNVAGIYSSQNKHAQALEHIQQSLVIYEELGNLEGVCQSLMSIGAVHRAQGEYDSALEYFQRSLAGNEELGDNYGIGYALNNIGLTYQDLGNYTKSLEYCTKGLDLVENAGVLVLQRDACLCLYDAYKAVGKGNEALVYLEKYHVIQDSLQLEETAKKLQQMEFEKVMLMDSIAKADEARLVQEAHEEEIRVKNQTRNWTAAAGLLALLLAGGFYSRWRYVRRSRDIISKERDRSENLLLNILPAEIAEELKEKGEAAARDFDMVSILFTDFKGFTQASEQLSAGDLVDEINVCFKAFDAIVEKHGIEKIKTIGDAYMAAGGLPVPDENAARNTVLAGLEMQAFMKARKAERVEQELPFFEMRVGIHTGPVVAGIVGVKKFQYDIWGDTVNTASRMESSGEVGQVNISEATYELVKDVSTPLSAGPLFTFTPRGKVQAKGKGELEMYFVERAA